MNLMTLWSQDKVQLDLLLKEHQMVEKSSDTDEGDIKSLLGCDCCVVNNKDPKSFDSVS